MSRAPGPMGTKEQAEGLRGVFTWDPEAGHGRGGSEVRSGSGRRVPGVMVRWRLPALGIAKPN